MNMAALMIVNEFDNFTGYYFEQKLDNDLLNADDYLSFPDVKQYIYDSVRMFQAINVFFYVVMQSLDFYQQEAICKDFDSFFEQQFELKTGFAPTPDFQPIFITRLVIKYLFYVSLISPVTIGLVLLFKGRNFQSKIL